MIIELLSKYSDIINDYRIRKFRTIGNSYEVILEVHFVDSTTLYVRDYFFPDNVRKYSYHLQDDNGDCITRWDNVPHHQTSSTFPFHMHIGRNEDIEDSEAMTFEKALKLIKKRINANESA